MSCNAAQVSVSSINFLLGFIFVTASQTLQVWRDRRQV
jgi:hypothetical protein